MAKAAKKLAVYRIVNTVSGTYYIGSSTNLYERWRTHKNKLRAGNHPNPQLQASWTKHGGVGFRFVILAEFESVQDMEVCEEALLIEHVGGARCCNLSTSATSPWRQTGERHPNYGKPLSEDRKVNLRGITKQQWLDADPRTGRTHTPEAKAAISARVQQALSEGRAGKFIPTAETRLKMSEALKGNQCAKGYKRTPAECEAIRQRTLGNQQWLGRTHTEESKLKMSKGVSETTTGRQFSSLTETLSHYGMTMPTLRRVLKSGRPITKGKFEGLTFSYS